ncbi:Alpha/Beta hydrolase protein [Leptodontidium sp. MPI-SDFR-AT-0119]|nr:Alpha/Beta hydrolase protein [Leptodontidium sp. MPI-SDFR-AT-0119]
MIHLNSVFSRAVLNGLAAVAAAAALSSVQAQPLPIVDLGYAVHESTYYNSTGKFYAFDNIRFAEPPTGARRFLKPVPVTTVNRTINNGARISPICPQGIPLWFSTSLAFVGGASVESLPPVPSSFTAGNLSSIPPPVVGTSEDCLFLDVKVPKTVFDAPRNQRGAPVIVWIYGGGYTTGDKQDGGPLNPAGSFNPAGLIASSLENNGQGIVYVALNYRVGLYGFLAGSTFSASGTPNAGLYDQRLALQWIQQNIAKFGGDPTQVTLMGESAGGSSILHQITAFGGFGGKSPFQQGILQSPGFFPIPNNQQQEDTYQRTLQYATLIAARSILTVDALRNLTDEQLYQVNAAVVGTSPYTLFTYGPAVDGVFVPKLPGELLAAGLFDKSINVMAGHNSNEGLLFASPFVQDNDAFRSFVKTMVPTISANQLDYITTILYPPIFNGSYSYTSQIDRTALFISEFFFTCNTRFVGLAYEGKSWSYYFNIPPGFHASDISYTFFTGDTSTGTNATVAKTLQAYLTSFTSTRNPNRADVPFFPTYGANASTQVIGTSGLGTQLPDSVGTGLAAQRCAYWQKSAYYS